jgi:hypothetical protein
MGIASFSILVLRVVILLYANKMSGGRTICEGLL